MSTPAAPHRLRPFRLWLTVLLLALSTIVQASGPAPDPDAAKYERRFLEDMIEHHMMAVHMSQDCVSRATHQELTATCGQIITAQQAEIQQMRFWLATWYGISGYQPRMPPGHEKRMEKLASLSGSQFEIEFMQQMIRHHRKAVIEGSQCMDRAYHQDLVEMCADIVTTQVAEMRRMQTWLCSWYGICRRNPA